MKPVTFGLILATWVGTLGATTPSELIAQHRAQSAPAVVRTHTSPSATPAVAASHAERTERTPKTRRFRTLGEYRRIDPVRSDRSLTRKHRTSKPKHRADARRFGTSRTSHKLGHYVGDGWFVDDNGRYDEEFDARPDRLWVPTVHRPQHGYRHYRRQWYLTYLYERAHFTDAHGYYYGYFDRYGFEFDGVFYAYDRSYTYQDRLHGKGLFEHRFYRPQRRERYAHDAGRSGERRGRHFYFRWSF
jgi:hypothetical protein